MWKVPFSPVATGEKGTLKKYYGCGIKKPFNCKLKLYYVKQGRFKM
jgi:hypothetical protein